MQDSLDCSPFLRLTLEFFYLNTIFRCFWEKQGQQFLKNWPSVEQSITVDFYKNRL